MRRSHETQSRDLTVMLNRLLSLLSGSQNEKSATTDRSLETASTDTNAAKASGAPDADSTIPFLPGDFSIDDYRPLKVIVVGAGFSGIAAGIRYATLIGS